MLRQAIDDFSAPWCAVTATVKTLLITGASSYLAGALVPIAAARAQVLGVAREGGRVLAPARPVELDLTRRQEVLSTVAQYRPAAIIHAAACNPGDGDDKRMHAVNTEATGYVAEAASQHGARLVHVSTDVVFDGENAPYSDDAVPSPLASNAYATSKAAGEAEVCAHCPDAAIVRTSLIYGDTRMDRGTAGFLSRMAAGETLRLFTDVWRQPIHDRALAEALVQLALDLPEVSGTLNLAGGEVMTRHAFALRMFAHWNVKAGQGIESGSAQGLQGVPMDCRLRLDRARALGLATPGVSEVLGPIRDI